MHVVLEPCQVVEASLVGEVLSEAALQEEKLKHGAPSVAVRRPELEDEGDMVTNYDPLKR